MSGSRESFAATRAFDDRPLLVFWEMTKACLLACRHCRADAQHEPGADDLSTADGLALLDDLAATGRPRPIMILTGGDCLMRDDVVDLTAYATQVQVPVAVSPSVTSKLTATMLRTLRAQKVRTASVSLDGATSRTHDKIRGVEGHFEATLRAIDVLRGLGYTVQVNTTVMRHNAAELGDFPALLKRTGVKVWEVFFLVATGRGVLVEPTSARENEDVCHFLVDVQRHGFTVRTVEAPFFRRVALERARTGEVPPEEAFDLGSLYAQLSERLRSRPAPPPAPIRAPGAATRDGKGVIFIANNGDVFPSGFLPLRLGNVRTQGVVEIYRDHPLLHSIRNAEFSGRCGRCEYADICGGSRAQAYARSSDPLAEDPSCVYVPAPGARPVRLPVAQRGR